MLLGLVLLGLAGVILSVHIGSVQIPIGEVWAALLGRLPEDSTSHAIVYRLRLPRVIVAAVVGMGLATSGAVLQGLMRNPLAAPNIVGVTAGAGLAATIAVVTASGLAWALPPAAFAGAMISGAIVYVLSWQPGLGTAPVRMVLAGVAVAAVLNAIATTLMLAFPERTPEVILWMAGTLNGTSWPEARLATPYLIAGVLGAMLLARPLNVLQLGDDAARGVGVRVELIRVLAMVCACLLAAAAVSVAGLIGFVGLIVPQIARLAVGANHHALIPVSAAGGCVLMIWADLGARTLFGGQELPVGVVTALIGGPYFIVLLYRAKVL